MSRAILLLLLSAATATAADKPFLGVRFGDDARIEHVFPGAPAEQAKIQVGDRIIKVAVRAEEPDTRKERETTTIESTEQVREFLRARRVGDTLVMTVERDGEKVMVVPTLVKHTVKYYLTQRDPPRIPGGTVQLGGGSIGGDFATSGNFVITGRATVAGSLTQSWTGIMDLKLTKVGEPAPLKVEGALSLAGLLYAHFDAHEPKVGDRYELISGATSITGEFDELMLPKLKENLAWRVVYDNLEKMRDLDGDRVHDVTLVVIDGRMPLVAD